MIFGDSKVIATPFISIHQNSSLQSVIFSLQLFFRERRGKLLLNDALAKVYIYVNRESLSMMNVEGCEDSYKKTLSSSDVGGCSNQCLP